MRSVALVENAVDVATKWAWPHVFVDDSIVCRPPVQPPHAFRLLSVLKSTPCRSGPDSFFSFPGKSVSVGGHPLFLYQ